VSSTANFADYSSALAACGGGYDDVELARVRLYKTEQYVKQLGATLWPEQIANTALAVGIAAAHAGPGPLRVIDFGGGAGIHFHAACRILPQRPQWAIAETRVMAEAARAAGLEAFDDLGMALRHVGEVDLLHTSGALHYVPDPLSTLEALVALNAPVFLLARLPVWKGQPFIMIQESPLSLNGLGPLPPGTADVMVRYPATLVDFDDIMARIVPRYRPTIAVDASSAALNVNGKRVPGITLVLTRRGAREIPGTVT
jgi:putative methyltransferase (TIGR04325 family)